MLRLQQAAAEDDARDSRATGAPPRGSQLGSLVYFRGNTRLARCGDLTRRHETVQPGYCTLRSRLLNVTGSSSAAAVKGRGHEDSARWSDLPTALDLSGVYSTTGHTPKLYDIAGVAEGMRRAIFCLAPRGDTGSSRRIYDAIVAGCIPVIVADDVQLAFEGDLGARVLPPSRYAHLAL